MTAARPPARRDGRAGQQAPRTRPAGGGMGSGVISEECQGLTDQAAEWGVSEP